MPNASMEKTMTTFDPEIKFAALDERQANTQRQLDELGRIVRDGFRDLTSSITTMRGEQSAAARTPWGTLATVGSLCLGVAIVIGGLVYQPVRESLLDAGSTIVENRKDTALQLDNLRKDMALSLSAIVKDGVTKSEMEWRTARGVEERKRTEDSLADIRSAQVPRPEYAERMRGIDAAFMDHQRQLDQLQRSFGDLYSPRDALRSMQDRLDKLEMMLRSRAP